MAHPGKTQAPGRAKAGQGGVDVPTQTPPQVGGAAGRWAGSWAIRRRECLEGVSLHLLHGPLVASSTDLKLKPHRCRT